MTHTVQSRAAPYTKINYDLRYCDFFNHKGRDLNHELHVLKGGRAQVAITEMSQGGMGRQQNAEFWQSFNSNLK